MNKLTPTIVAVVALAVLGACGDDTADTADPATMSQPPSSEAPGSGSAESPCGVTLAEVQALLPAGSGVTENSTPDPGRCNFTWDDGGPRGIDVAIVAGGRSSFEIPAGYEALDGFGDEAYASTTPGHASAFAFVGDDLYAADVVADGAGSADAGLHELCLELLDLTLG